MYAYDAFTIPANLAGCPAGTVPSKYYDKIPIGIQVMAAKGNEEYMFEILNQIEHGKN